MYTHTHTEGEKAAVKEEETKGGMCVYERVYERVF